MQGSGGLTDWPRSNRWRTFGEDCAMRWHRAVHHVESLAQSCAAMAASPVPVLRVTQLWVCGDILGPGAELEWVTVALCVDLPPEQVAWRTEPRGTGHWARATRLSKNPIVAWWRSAHAPVWNHRIVRPALIWDAADGVHEAAMAALRDKQGETVRSQAPTEPEYAARLRDELAVSLGAVRAATLAYDERRWGQGKLEAIADPLWRATEGYLDVLEAVGGR
jgi:hypothetical protein